MESTTLFSPEHRSDEAQSRYTTLDEVTLGVGEVMELSRFPEERLYYFTDGRGLMDIYPGDQYEIRQNTALWTTPMIPTEIRNTGQRPLHFAVFRVTGVRLPERAAEGLRWTAVDASRQRGAGIRAEHGLRLRNAAT